MYNDTCRQVSKLDAAAFTQPIDNGAIDMLQTIDSPGTRQFLCHLDLPIDIDTVKVRGGSLGWPDDEIQQPENAARFVLRRIQRMWSATADLSNTKLEFEIINMVDPRTKSRGLQLLADVLRPPDWVDEQVDAMRATCMKNLTLLLEALQEFNDKALLGKNLPIVPARPKGSDVEVVVCESPTAIEAAQDISVREARSKSKRPMLHAKCDRRSSFDIPAACPIDLQSLEQTATVESMTGYFQEPNTRTGTVKYFRSGKTNGITLHVSPDHFKGIFEAQLQEIAVDAKVKVRSATLAGRSEPMRRELLEFQSAPAQLSIGDLAKTSVVLPRVPDKLRVINVDALSYPNEERRTGVERRGKMQ